MLSVSSPPAARQLSLLINYHKNDSSCQYPDGTARSQREITGLPAFAAALRRPEGGHPGPFGPKILISERAGYYGPLPVLARAGQRE
jgi:hypothetical protein